MKTRRVSLYLAALVCAASAASQGVIAGEPSGRAIAATCAGCHGPDGYSVGTVPPLAGQSKGHIEQQLKDFKSGKRPSTIMGRIAKGYDDKEIDAVAHYFSKVK